LAQVAGCCAARRWAALADRAPIKLAGRVVDTKGLNGSNKAGDMGLASEDGGGVPPRADGPEPPVRASERLGLSLKKLPYLVGPVAFTVVIVLMRFGYVAHVRWWVWLIVLTGVTVINVAVDRIYQAHPTRFTLNLRVICQVAAITLVINLTGWGPVLWAAYIFIALENMARAGSRVWRTMVFWSLVGMVLGQIALDLGWLQSELSDPAAASLTVMGGFVLYFVIHLAGAIMEQNETALAQKEEAEAHLRLSEDRFRSLIQNSSDVTMILGDAAEFRYVSPAIKDLLQYEPDELFGRDSTEFVHPEDLHIVRTLLGGEFQSEPGTATLEFRMVRKDGMARDVEAVVSNQTSRPSVAGYVANIRDITERKKFEALLAHRALHDPLTGLANRQLILDRAGQMLERARRSGVPMAALFIDLDNFKDSNDSLGHGAGDKLLQMVAGRLLGILRSGDTVGRLGGDEFVILAEGVSFARGPEMIGERVHEVLKPAFHLPGADGMTITVSASIGIAVGNRPSAEELLRDADIALYRAKEAGRNQSVLFEHSMQSAAKERLTLKTNLESALEHNQFTLVYHPIFDLEGIQIQGAEALLRWQHPTRGTIEPDVFVPVLEERGLIMDVGRWVLNESCREAAAWHARGHRVSISVNVSMRQLESDQLLDDVHDALATHDLDPSLLILEVTESSLMRDSAATVARLNLLKHLGVKIAIDDFGTGYSSLAYLRQFPVDVLKIDRSFVADMSRSPDAEALVHTLVELGRTLGLVTLAEGIETHAQLEGLRAEHCDQGQGFLYSGPIDAGEMAALLDTVRAARPALTTGTAPGGAGAARPRSSPPGRRHAPVAGRSGPH
jgi:diguanylate cyclase (GGDEF)-like protein/PAS domain S-box-containing protein